MAVTRLGGTMEFAARHFLEKHGLEPGKDIVLIQIGSSADVVPAMTNGLVQSEVMSIPYLFIARRLGVCELTDLSQTGVRYPQAALVAKRSFLRGKREIVGQFIRSAIEAVDYLKTKPAMACGSWGDLRPDDADILKQGLITMCTAAFSPPESRPVDIKLLLEEAALSSVKAKGANPQDFIDEGR
jgi:ABC-type nitrate/sulfonate/bicarbonate transport system substrate-binding protein